MGKSAAILIDYRIGIDYCQDLTEIHELATEVLNYSYKESIQIDIRKECWRLLTSSISDLLSLYKYLRDEATRLLNKKTVDEALGEYIESVMIESDLNTHISGGTEQLPSINNLRESVREMGLNEFRAFVDDQIRIAQNGQRQLDLMLSQKYQRGGQNLWQFETAIDQHFDEQKDKDILVDSYAWAANGGPDSPTVLVTRRSSGIYSKKEKVYNSMSRKMFKITCPEMISKEIN